ncbi:hypothetical protein D3C81_1357950 [compost metagenome]
MLPGAGKQLSGLLCCVISHLRFVLLFLLQVLLRPYGFDLPTQYPSHLHSGLFGSHSQCFLNQIQTIATAALVTEPGSAPLLVIKTKAVFAATGRARLGLAVRLQGNAEGREYHRPVAGGGAYGL